MVATLLCFSLLFQDPVPGQAAPDPSRDQVIRQLLDRVEQLEAEVRELKARLVGGPPPLQPVPAMPAPDTPAAPPPLAEPMAGMVPSAASEFPTMQLRGFSDVSYRAAGRDAGTSSFAIGQFTLFITSSLSDHLSVVAEPVLEANDQNAFGFELERLLLQISANQYFSVGLGRYHTAIGWYNTAYHHSTWLQTAIGRPFLFEFEDKGGILPIHNVGFSATGRIPSGSARLRWVAEAGNGRASRSPLDEPTQNVRDENNGKAVNVALLARPDWLQGLEAGFSAYHDRLAPEGQSKIGQTILAAHVIYQARALEWLNEVVVIRDAVLDTDQLDQSTGFYTQISRQFGGVRPYFRYQYLDVPPTDPYLGDVGLMRGPSLGVRYDINSFAAFKLQYDHVRKREGSGADAVTTQFSFVF